MIRNSMVLTVILAAVTAAAAEPKKPVEIRQGGYVERVDPSVDYKSRIINYPPNTPAGSLKKLHVVSGFRVERAAGEPEVCSPVDAAFDAQGRLFVAEMIPYSEHNSAAYGSPRGRIVMLEDLDGDGRFERSSVFCDKLVWPTGLACFDGGLFVAAAPDLLYLKDTDGDGRADVRETVATGFFINNPAAVPNSLRWGLDNRIHGMPSQSAGELRQVRWERIQKRPEKPLSVRGRDFSMDPRTGQMRAESGGGQYGMAFDDWGAKFESSNSTPIAQIMYEERYLARNPVLPAPPARVPIWNYGSAIFRTSPPEPWRVIRMEMRVAGVFSGGIEGGGSPVGYFTGACGLMMPRPGSWPLPDRNDGFLGEGSGNLVHRMRLKPDGVQYLAYRVEEKRDFLTSDETWCRPVQFCGGPDGNLYVVDMYRACYEDADAVPPSVKKYMDLSAGWDRGRIWRVVPEGYKCIKTVPLAGLPTKELVALLGHPNGWHRETASRLLYERQGRAAIEPLRKLAAESPAAVGRMHALYVLEGLGALTAEAILPRMADAHPRVRENAVRLAERVLDRAVTEKLCAMAGDEDVRVRYQLAFTLGEIQGPHVVSALARIAARDPGDRWIRLAVLSSCYGRAADLFAELAAKNKNWRADNDAGVLLENLAEQVGLQNQEKQVEVLLRVLDGIGDGEQRLTQSTVLGLVRGLAKVASPLREKVATGRGRAAKVLRQIVEHSKVAALEEKRKVSSRLEAVRALALAPYGEIRDALPELLSSRQPREIQMAALETIGQFTDPDAGKAIAEAWPGFSPVVRREAAEVLFGRKQWLPVLLAAVEKKLVLPSQIDPARIQLLVNHPDATVRKQAAAVLGKEKLGRRQDVIAAYRDVLAMKGDPRRGKDVFKRNCATCHKLEGVGYELGLPLTTVQNKGEEFMLMNILDPNLQVLPEYINYVIVTNDGRSVTGMIVSETASSVTLRRAEGQSDTVLRGNIDQMQSTGLSIMPEGLEKQLTKQDMADVIGYLMGIR